MRFSYDYDMIAAEIGVTKRTIERAFASLQQKGVFCQVYFLNFAVKIPFFTKGISLYLAGQIMHPVA